VAYWRSASSDVPPDYLYHYTSAAAVREILRSREFWLTSFEGQNDATEIAFGLKAIAEKIRELLATERSSLVIQGFEARLALLDQSTEGLTFDPQLMMASSVAMFSLSTEGDDLSQWRGYSQNGAGFALMIDSAVLRNMCDGRATLVRCRYDENDFAQLVRPVYDEYATPTRAGSGANAPSLQDFWSDCVALAARMKHRAFRAENEWRLIQTNVPLVSMETVVVRNRLRAITRLPWDADGPRNPVFKVRIGPQESPEIAARALGPLLAECCGDTRMYEVSEVPFRPR
jgi:hypothetical protein